MHVLHPSGSLGQTARLGVGYARVSVDVTCRAPSPFRSRLLLHLPLGLLLRLLYAFLVVGVGRQRVILVIFDCDPAVLRAIG